MQLALLRSLGRVLDPWLYALLKILLNNDMLKILGVKSGLNEASGNNFVPSDLPWINTEEQI